MKYYGISISMLLYAYSMQGMEKTLDTSLQERYVPSLTSMVAHFLGHQLSTQHTHYFTKKKRKNENGIQLSPAADEKLLRVLASQKNKVFWRYSPSMLEGKGHEKEASAVTFTHDGDYCITGGGEGKLCFWTVPATGLLYSFAAHIKRVTALLCHHSNNFFLSASHDGAVYLWKKAPKDDKYETIEKIRTYQHDSPVECIAVDDNWELLVVGCHNGTIYLWDISTAHCFNKFTEHEKIVSQISLTCDKRYILSVGSDTQKSCTVCIWDLARNMCAQKLYDKPEQGFTACAISPAGSHILKTSWNSNVLLFDINKQKATENFIPKTNVTAVTFSKDGNYIATAHSTQGVCLYTYEGNMVKSFELSNESKSFGARPLKIVLSPDNLSIAAVYNDGFVRIWTCRTLLEQLTSQSTLFVAMLPHWIETNGKENSLYFSTNNYWSSIIAGLSPEMQKTLQSEYPTLKLIEKQLSTETGRKKRLTSKEALV